MAFKFEQLEVWHRALDYCDVCYLVAEQLPKQEAFNPSSQLCRAATSVALKIAEGFTGQTNAKQSRFLGLAVRSVIKTIACYRIIQRRRHQADAKLMAQLDSNAQTLARQIHAMRRSLDSEQKWLRENTTDYISADGGEIAL